MTKDDIIKKFRERELPGVSYADCKALVECVLDIMQDGIRDEGKVMLSDFMTLKVVPRQKTNYINPRTGEKVIRPVGQRLKVIPGKTLKNILDENRCTLA